MINFEQTIISQYSNSATIVGLIKNFNDCIDPRSDLQAFYDYVFNIETAQGFGLDIWGRRVGVGRYLKVPSNPNNFGFLEQTEAAPFDDEPFYDGPPISQTYKLSDDAYRKLILVKALANISISNAKSINQLLKNLFADRGRAYVNDLGNMQMRYTFEFLLTDYEAAIIGQSGAFPKPAGVLVTVLNSEQPAFGFEEMGGDAYPFDEGTFLPEGSYYAI